MTWRLHRLTLAFLLSGCITGKAVGDLDDTSDGDGSDGDGSAGDDSGDGSDADASAGDDGVPSMCLEEPTQCTSDGFCSGEGCTILQHWDESGCPRPSCSSDADCPEGLSCFQFDDWNRSTSSGWGCDVEDGECVCGETADASEGVAHCVPDEQMPPPVDRCVPPAPGPAFSIDPLLGDGDGDGAAQCTVSAVGPLRLDCTGDFVGTFAITLATDDTPALAIDQPVTLEYHAEAQIEWLDQWLRITADDGSVVVAAVQASTLLPPDAPDPFWPAGLEVSTADIGCIAYGCDDESPMMITGRAIRVELGGDVADFAGGEAGTVPGTFDGPAPTIAVQEAREGACGINLGDQSGWTSLVIVRPQ